MKKLIYSAASLFGIIALLAIWGILIEPRLIDESRWTVEIPFLPPAWHGKEIALIADLQVGMWFNNTDTTRRIIERLVRRRPAAVLIAGDFIYHPIEDEPEDIREEFEFEYFREEVAEEIRRVVDILRPLTEAGIPVYAVLGNHDYAMEAETVPALSWVADMVATALSAIDVQVLRNESIPISPGAGSPSASLYIVGIGAHLPEADDPAAALATVPVGAPRLVLMHHPASFAHIAAGEAPLAMAAHTHGGQVRLPFFPEWTWMSYVKNETIHADGWIDGYGQPGNRLYVNRGIGFSKFPVRINCPPELTIFTLRRERD